MSYGMKRIHAFVVYLVVFWAGAVQSAEKNLYRLMETESQIIKFDHSIKRAMVANPDLASVKVVNSRELLISGQKAGKTELMVWYQKDASRLGKTIVLDITPDASRKEEISQTVEALLSQLDPDGTVKYELRNIWVKSTSSVRREIDVLGNQIDADADLKTKVTDSDNQRLQQETQKVGALGASPLAGNYLVVLSGTVPHQARKKRIYSVISALGLSVVNTIRVTGKDQIKLAVRVAEVAKGNPFSSGFAFRDKKDRFGIFPPGNLGTNALFSLNNQPDNTAQIAFPNPTGFQIGFNPEQGSLFGVLSILEGHQLARVLAKPELIVQSGSSASFLVGGETPIPAAQGNGAISVTFKEFGVRLRFSPVITDNGDIQVTVEQEVSDIDETAGVQSGTIIVPGFRSRKANTTIRLAPGQSFVIGGLIQDSIRSQVSQIPILGDIPILGALFRSTSYEHDKSELAILVTPTLVDPIGKETKVQLPGENIARPDNFDAFFLGKVAEVLPKGSSSLPESLVKIGLEDGL